MELLGVSGTSSRGIDIMVRKLLCQTDLIFLASLDPCVQCSLVLGCPPQEHMLKTWS